MENEDGNKSKSTGATISEEISKYNVFIPDPNAVRLDEIFDNDEEGLRHTQSFVYQLILLKLQTMKNIQLYTLMMFQIISQLQKNQKNYSKLVHLLVLPQNYNVIIMEFQQRLRLKINQTLTHGHLME